MWWKLFARVSYLQVVLPPWNGKNWSWSVFAMKESSTDFYTTATTICTIKLWRNINNKKLWKVNTLVNTLIIRMFSNIYKTSAQNFLTFRSISLLPSQVRSSIKPYGGKSVQLSAVQIVQTIFLFTSQQKSFNGPLNSQN